jgi:type II secretory pathway pseudopilin PulG
MRSRRTAGLTLLELALLLSLVGVALAVTVPTFVRTVRTSKIAEASENLERLLHGAASYYESSHETAEGGLRVQCIPEAAGPAPVVASTRPVAMDFHDPGTPGAATWRALGFAPEQPVRYRYTFSTSHTGCMVAPGAQRELFRVRAEGNLDGDQQLSRFERRVLASGDGTLTVDPMLIVDDRIE